MGDSVCFHFTVRDEVLGECSRWFKIYWCHKNFLALRENLPLIYHDCIANTQRACTLIYLLVGLMCIHILSLRDGKVSRMLVIPSHLPRNVFG